MKWKSLPLLCGFLIVVGFPAYGVGLEGIKAACLRVERVDAGYGVTDRGIDAYAMAWLKARVFKREPDAALGCMAGSAEIRVAVVLGTLDMTRICGGVFGSGELRKGGDDGTEGDAVTRCEYRPHAMQGLRGRACGRPERRRAESAGVLAMPAWVPATGYAVGGSDEHRATRRSRTETISGSPRGPGLGMQPGHAAGDR